VFDEMPHCITFLAIDAPSTHFYISNHVIETQLQDQLVSLSPNPASMRTLVRIANNQPHDGGLVHLQELARALVRGHSVIVPADQWAELDMPSSDAKFKGHLDIMVIVPPVWFQHYRSVTMMGARCLTHFTSLIWQRLFQVEFRETDPFSLPTAHSAKQSRRVTISWIFEERVTRALLARKARQGGKLFLATCEAVAAFYDGEPFLWSAPRPGEDKEHGVENDFWAHHDRANHNPGAFTCCGCQDGPMG
jgi:hypothetical protein